LSKKTYKNINEQDEKDYLLQVVKARHLQENWKHPFPRQKVWKGPHELKMGQLWKKNSNIEKHY
jgi:hypothetical protein